jgi:hypothetical protein
MRGAAPERVANVGANEYQCEAQPRACRERRANEHQCEAQPPSVLPTSGECMSETNETLKRVG